MKKDDIKENVDEMLLKICEYIKAADLSDDEDVQIKIESAMSIIVSAIDYTDKPKENIDYIADQQSKILDLITLSLVDVTTDILFDKYDKGRWI